MKYGYDFLMLTDFKLKFKIFRSSVQLILNCSHLALFVCDAVQIKVHNPNDSVSQ